MVHIMIKKILFFAAISFMLSLSSCYYDKAESLRTISDCDTTKVTYSITIAPMINSNCEGCHSGGTPSGGVMLSNYSETKTAADNGSLLGTIKHESNWSPMPKGGNKLSDCNIRQLEIWIKNGTPNN